MQIVHTHECMCTRNCFHVRMHGGMRTQLRTIATEWGGNWFSCNWNGKGFGNTADEIVQ